MVRRVAWRLWSGWVVLALVAGTAWGDEPIEPGTISGRVVDAEGKGIGGAGIWLGYITPGSIRANVTHDLRTDADGRFHSGPVAPTPDVARLTVSAEGYATSYDPVEQVAIFAGANTDLGSIRLDRGRTFTGRVIDADGTPRVGITVTLRVLHSRRGHSLTDPYPRLNPVTDADGRFRTVSLPVGQLGLLVQVPDRRRAASPSRVIRPGPGEEDVGVIRLEPDVPITVTVRDEDGLPVAGVTLRGTVGIATTTGIDGKFTVRGSGANPAPIWMTLNRPGFVDVSGRLAADSRGLRFQPIPSGAGGRPPAYMPPIEGEPVRDLVLVMRRARLFEGVAVDAATGRPVELALAQATVSRVERPIDGEPTLQRGVGRFERLDAGRFRIEVADPGEYHLAVTLEGYRPAEVFTPRATDRTTLGGVVVRLQPKQDDIPEPVKQSISGRVTRAGQPVPTGWITLATREPTAMAPSAELAHGRTVPNSLRTHAVALFRDGSFALDVPFPGDAYSLLVTEPGQAATTVGPWPLRPGESKAVDIACRAGGRVRGQVTGVPPDWQPVAWVVAFNGAGLRFEARTEPDGTFELPLLPPGEYGLKAGHDAYQDAETYPGLLARNHPESYQILADPWKRAKRVTVAAGQYVDGVEVAWPD